MASVIPSSSALSDEAAGGGMYLYSFFNTLLVKYGFSLKCYNIPQTRQPLRSAPLSRINPGRPAR